MGLNYVALIPAKGHSLGVPRKNLQFVGDKTLLARAIESAMSVGRISSVVVSTDDAEISDLAVSLGASVHMRNSDALNSDATAAEVVRDFFAGQEKIGDGASSRIVYLQPTSPFRTQYHVESALDALERVGAESLVAVCSAKQLPEKMVVLDGERIRIDPDVKSGHGTNRQDLPQRFYANGAIYIFSEAEFNARSEVPIEGALFFEMDEVASVDIDSSADLEIARALAAHVGI
jgi:CMP-N,N'-diacetyllegionaminic acid synthase